MSDLKYLNLKIAKHLIDEVEKVAQKCGVPVVIAVVNEWGTAIAVHFMDGALPASFDIAINKAYTSATVRLSTKELRDLSKDGGDLFGIINTNNNKIVAFPGGFPLKVENKVVGGIGISGGSGEYDNEIALFGEKVYREVVRWIATKS